MKKILFLMLSVLMLTLGTNDAHAQSFLKRLKDKAVETVKDKVENKVERSVGNSMDELLDGESEEQSGKKSKKSKKSKSANSDDDSDTPKAKKQKTAKASGSDSDSDSEEADEMEMDEKERTQGPAYLRNEQRANYHAKTCEPGNPKKLIHEEWNTLIDGKMYRLVVTLEDGPSKGNTTLFFDASGNGFQMYEIDHERKQAMRMDHMFGEDSYNIGGEVVKNVKSERGVTYERCKSDPKEDKILDVMCDHYIVTSPIMDENNPDATVTTNEWYDPNTGMTMRVIESMGGYHAHRDFEIAWIEYGKQDPKLFQIPEDYKVLDGNQMGKISDIIGNMHEIQDNGGSQADMLNELMKMQGVQQDMYKGAENGTLPDKNKKK